MTLLFPRSGISQQSPCLMKSTATRVAVDPVNWIWASGPSEPLKDQRCAAPAAMPSCLCGFPPWERCKDSHFHEFSMMCKVGNHENPPFCKVFKVSRLAMIENQWETYPYKLRRTSLSRVCKDTEYPQMINELWWIMPAQRELENLLVWCINAI